MSSKLAPSPEIFQSQEAAFIKHYEWLLRWALQFTNHDRERAEDLVQQVFAQFALAQTDLSAVQDISAYLYKTLRNTHLSELRLAVRTHRESQSILDYGIADAALGASDPGALFQAQDQLRRVCQYACLRKQSSRAGSVLILRFFHGYHVSEIAAVLGGTCQSVRQSLKFARQEARVFLEYPGSLKFIGKTPNAGLTFTGTVCTAEELLAELRRAIFRSCESECLASDALRDLYVERHVLTADNTTFAHIVSCARCLDAINRQLGLPLLSQRHPADALGPNNNWRGGPGSSGNSGGTQHSFQSKRKAKNPGESSSFLLKCRRRATELFEHHPGELTVSVNGHVLGSQSVNSRTSRLRLDVSISEPLNFVEILGDERSRLLVMTIDPPPDGEPTQERCVRLSEGRYVEAVLRHGHPWPMLEIVYHDPNFIAEPELSTLELNEAWSSDSAGNDADGSSPDDATSGRRSSRRSIRAGLFDLFGAVPLFGRPWWARPGLISAVVSALLIGALLFLRFNVAPRVTAASLLERASASELLPAGSDWSIHRVFNLEQRNSSGALVATSRIEIWRNGETGLTVRRVYDQNKLILGEWESHSVTEGKDLRRLYRRGQPQQIEPLTHNLNHAIRNHELWQLEPSARDYAEIIGHVDSAQLSEEPGFYVINYSNAQGEADLLQATLRLRKSDLHPIAQVLVIRGGSETYRYGFEEVSFDQPPLRSVDPAVFKPDAELISATPKTEKTPGRESAHGLSLAPPPVTASADLEVEAAYVLDKFRSRYGDQLTLSKTAAGLLEVRGVVESEATRKEILDAFSQIGDQPALKVQISTVAEVMARQQGKSNNLIREFTGSDEAIPAYAELKRYFAAQAGSETAPENVDNAVREFAGRVVGQSRRALGHALELKQLTARFTDQQLQDLTPSTRTKWVTLVRNHAEALRREVSSLNGELRPIFFENQNVIEAPAGVEITNDASLTLSVERLYELVLTSDEAVRSVFAASSGDSTLSLIKSARFQRDLLTAQRLSEKIRQAAEHR